MTPDMPYLCDSISEKMLDVLTKTRALPCLAKPQSFSPLRHALLFRLHGHPLNLESRVLLSALV